MTALIEAIETEPALDKGAQWYANFSANWTKPAVLKNLLSGTWLGHPLHPLLTDLPIGAWGAALLLDLTAGDEGADAARRLVGAGVLAAVPTAAAGACDYSSTHGAEQRVGFVHAAANVIGVSLQVASWLVRRRGHRTLGVVLTAAGLGVTSAAAYLGGYLSFVRGVGVNRTAFQEPRPVWTDVAGFADLAEGRPHKVAVDGVDVVLVRRGAKVFAVSAVCTHAGGPLDQGKVADGQISCPWHGSTFRLGDGSVVRGPASVAEPAWETLVLQGRVSISPRVAWSPPAARAASPLGWL